MKNTICPVCRFFTGMLIYFFIVSCTPVTLFSVDLRYPPAKLSRGKDLPQEKKQALALAAFVDERKLEDKLFIGAVVKDDGRRTPIVPKNAIPADAVTVMVKEYLTHGGYRVVEKPTVKDSAAMMLGGEINELDITCQDSLAVKKYSSRVRLTVLLSDVKTGNIIYKVSAEIGSSLEHYRMSEEMLGEQISDALSVAVEKIFEGEELDRRIRDAAIPSP